jgi:hypothetical protein
VAVLSELFSNVYLENNLTDKLQFPSIAARDAQPVDYLRHVEEAIRRSRPNLDLFGFKLFLWHNEVVLRHVVRDPEYEILVLRRSNLLAQWASAQAAKRDKVYAIRASAAAENNPEVPLIPEKLKFAPRKFELFVAEEQRLFELLYGLLDTAKKPYIATTYDELRSPDTARDLLSRLRLVPPGTLSTALRKQNSDDILSRFEDPAAVSEFLRVRGWENWSVEGVPRIS